MFGDYFTISILVSPFLSQITTSYPSPSVVIVEVTFQVCQKKSNIFQVMNYWLFWESITHFL